MPQDQNTSNKNGQKGDSHAGKSAQGQKQDYNQAAEGRPGPKIAKRIQPNLIPQRTSSAPPTQTRQPQQQQKPQNFVPHRHNKRIPFPQPHRGYTAPMMQFPSGNTGYPAAYGAPGYFYPQPVPYNTQYQAYRGYNPQGQHGIPPPVVKKPKKKSTIVITTDDDKEVDLGKLAQNEKKEEKKETPAPKPAPKKRTPVKIESDDSTPVILKKEEPKQTPPQKTEPEKTAEPQQTKPAPKPVDKAEEKAAPKSTPKSTPPPKEPEKQEEDKQKEDVDSIPSATVPARKAFVPSFKKDIDAKPAAEKPAKSSPSPKASSEKRSSSPTLRYSPEQLLALRSLASNVPHPAIKTFVERNMGIKQNKNQNKGGYNQNSRQRNGQRGKNRSNYQSNRKPRKPKSTYQAGENAWKGSNTAVKDDSDRISLEIHLILNQLTPEKFNKLVKKFRTIKGLANFETKNSVKLIFDKAINEPNFVDVYANFCVEVGQCYKLLSQEAEDPEKLEFSRSLLNYTQQQFEGRIRNKKETEKPEEELPEGHTAADLAEKKAKKALQKKGIILFIGELYKKQLLGERIIHQVVKELLLNRSSGDKPNHPTPDDIELLCLLLESVGQTLDHPGAQKYTEYYFNHLQRLVKKSIYSSRYKFLILNVIDLRKRKWKQLIKKAEAKTIQELHEEHHKEEMEKAKKSRDYRRSGGHGGGRPLWDRRTGGGRPGSGRQGGRPQYQRQDSRKKSGSDGWQSTGGRTNRQQERSRTPRGRNNNNQPPSGKVGNAFGELQTDIPESPKTPAPATPTTPVVKSPYDDPVKYRERVIYHIECQLADDDDAIPDIKKELSIPSNFKHLGYAFIDVAAKPKTTSDQQKVVVEILNKLVGDLIEKDHIVGGYKLFLADIFKDSTFLEYEHILERSAAFMLNYLTADQILNMGLPLHQSATSLPGNPGFCIPLLKDLPHLNPFTFVATNKGIKFKGLLRSQKGKGFDGIDAAQCVFSGGDIKIAVNKNNAESIAFGIIAAVSLKNRQPKPEEERELFTKYQDVLKSCFKINRAACERAIKTQCTRVGKKDMEQRMRGLVKELSL